MKTERELLLGLREHVVGQWDEVENAARSGMFDVYGTAAADGSGWWLELKIGRPRAHLEATQWNWCYRHLKARAQNLRLLAWHNDEPKLFSANVIINHAQPIAREGGGYTLNFDNLEYESYSWPLIADYLGHTGIYARR